MTGDAGWDAIARLAVPVDERRHVQGLGTVAVAVDVDDRRQTARYSFGEMPIRR